MKKVWKKKEYLAAAIIVVLFVFVSVTSISSIQLLQGNARVVNYGGIVRGATQKLIKEEIMGWDMMQSDPSFAQNTDWYPDDALLERLDTIVEELLSGQGPNNLIVLPDDTYLDDMRKVQNHWQTLKGLIYEVRDGAPPQELFESSQIYFELVNDAVFSAEAYSETQVEYINTALLFVNGIFILLIIAGIVFYIRSLAVRRRADALGKIAYVDPLTGLDNRASCERLIARIRKAPEDQSVAVLMFDMNDLKLTNDFFGHKGGDRIIAEFAKAMKESAGGEGFVGRYGGDEFLVVFEPGDETVTKNFLLKVRDHVDSYNERQQNKLEMIHYAAGYSIAKACEQDIADIIDEADNRMYANKRKTKAFVG